MTKRQLLILFQIALVVIWTIFLSICVMKVKKPEQDPDQKVKYQFDEPKDSNTENLTSGQRLFYEELNEEKEIKQFLNEMK
jgi:hypothetical protein